MTIEQYFNHFSEWQKNLLALLVLLLFSLFIIPVIGFYDEGNSEIYAGVIDYAFNGLFWKDLVFLTLFFVLFGILVFNLLILNTSLKQNLLLRLFATLFIVPIGIPLVLVSYIQLIGS